MKESSILQAVCANPTLWHPQDTIEFLIENVRVNVTYQNKFGWTALHHAAALGSPRTVEALMPFTSPAWLLTQQSV